MGIKREQQQHLSLLFSVKLSWRFWFYSLISVPDREKFSVMMSSEKFCLKWNDFESNICSAFRDLKNEKDFFDVTIACEEEQVSAHKVILSACSPFFKNLLRRNQHQHPLLYLKGISFSGIQSVLNFMYYGEVNIAQEDLNTFLAVAEELQVKGLTQSQNQTKSSPPMPQSQSRPTSKIKPVPPRRSLQVAAEDDEVQEVIKQEQMEAGKAEELQVAAFDDQGPYFEQYEENYAEEYAMSVSDSNSTMVEKGNLHHYLARLSVSYQCAISQECMWMILLIC